MKGILRYLLQWNSATGGVEKRSLSAHEVALKQVNARRRSGVSADTPSRDVVTESTAEVSDSRTLGGRAVASGVNAGGTVDHIKQARKERKRAARGERRLS